MKDFKEIPENAWISAPWKVSRAIYSQLAPEWRDELGSARRAANGVPEASGVPGMCPVVSGMISEAIRAL